ncbi:coiled-coil domain-containing protein 39-like isoform X2 [Hydra vulgaris]|uniref:Coiled-coil domain-containing protein 39-like isoform X2 n=1 Tax=Hydra vulgaris TaxID=6087 RepID=A0ABM4BW29_HYDVU
MKITRDDAFRILGVQEESSPDEVRSSYKRLALKWHPDKHGETQSKEEATHKFQEVSAAYKKLTTNAADMDDETDDSDFMNIAEMMELFANIFFQNGGCRYPHHAINCCDCDVGGDYYYSDEEYYGYTDDESEPESLDIAHRLRHKYEARKYMTKDTIQTQWRVTEEEALKNARELIAEEELEKRREEKKKTKRKKKEKKKLKEKVKKEQEVILENHKSLADTNSPTNKFHINKEDNKILSMDFSTNSLSVESIEDIKNKNNNHQSTENENINKKSNNLLSRKEDERNNKKSNHNSKKDELIDKKNNSNLSKEEKSSNNKNSHVSSLKEDENSNKKSNHLSSLRDEERSDKKKNHLNSLKEDDHRNKKKNPPSSTTENEQSNKKNKNHDNKKINGSTKSYNLPQYKNNILNPERKNRNSKTVDSEGDEDAIDTTSAFFLRAASKAPSVQTSVTLAASINKEDNKDKKKNIIVKPQQQSKKIKKQSPINIEQSEPKTSTESNNNNVNNAIPIVINRDIKSEVIVDNEQIILQSRQVAVKGNQMAHACDYQGAVTMFTKAIQLDPNDHRFFGNRSYCYDRLEQYENALKDGDAAIRLAPEWPKGYFRKGRALTGLKRFQEAEQVFQHVLTLDPVCDDAQYELLKVRVQIFTDMGFAQPLSEQAVRTYGNVQQALEALLAGKVSDEDDLYLSDEEADEVEQDVDFVDKKEDNYSQVIQNNINNLKSQQKTNIRNTESRCNAIWVGNVDPEMVTEKQMNQLFSKCGKVSSVRILPHKYCAFVNFIDPADASAAMEKLQGVGLGNQKLLLRFPNNPPPGSYVPENSATPQTKNKPSSISESSNDSSKLSGPVNGNECYFWRTTGCVFENQCRYKHVRGHKGVDLAKVHAKYGKIPC